jgi:hypothetical protein
LPLLQSFSLGRRFATSLLASHLTDNYRNPVSRGEDRSSYAMAIISCRKIASVA